MKTLEQTIQKIAYEAANSEYHDSMSGSMWTHVSPEGVHLASYMFEFVARKFDLHIYSLSFDEGNSSNIIEIQSTREIDFLQRSAFLLQHVIDQKSQEFHYRLASRSREDIENIRKKLNNYEDILNIEIRFS